MRVCVLRFEAEAEHGDETGPPALEERDLDRVTANITGNVARWWKWKHTRASVFSCLATDVA